MGFAVEGTLLVPGARSLWPRAWGSRATTQATLKPEVDEKSAMLHLWHRAWGSSHVGALVQLSPRMRPHSDKVSKLPKRGDIGVPFQ